MGEDTHLVYRNGNRIAVIWRAVVLRQGRVVAQRWVVSHGAGRSSHHREFGKAQRRAFALVGLS